MKREAVNWISSRNERIFEVMGTSTKMGKNKHLLVPAKKM